MSNENNINSTFDKLETAIDYYILLPDTENNFTYFNGILNLCGTIMVQFKANYRKTKQSILIKTTYLMGVVCTKIVNNFECLLHHCYKKAKSYMMVIPRN